MKNKLSLKNTIGIALNFTLQAIPQQIIETRQDPGQAIINLTDIMLKDIWYFEEAKKIVKGMGYNIFYNKGFKRIEITW